MLRDVDVFNQTTSLAARPIELSLPDELQLVGAGWASTAAERTVICNHNDAPTIKLDILGCELNTKHHDRCNALLLTFPNRLRYRGRQRNLAWFRITAAVYNLIRITALDAQHT